MMKLWENLFAGDLLYQDLGDCSLCGLPVSPILDSCSRELKLKSKPKENKRMSA